MEASTGIEPVYTDLQCNAYQFAILKQELMFPNLQCVSKCANRVCGFCVKHCVEHSNAKYCVQHSVDKHLRKHKGYHAAG
ncbi:hypothetical protein SAMN05444000_1527 [Shimia gijangensis]|uniref:Uncharacterized protein n=1 Tax=Shimia gijangensis TaxID=1470563 RepID=A0A1M6U5E5_9RHOB|nr:hypothetical protein SAMN05444000_1527 [Shimia gijangensis]